MTHYDKYLKYKNKYIKLKNQIGGTSKTYYDLSGKSLYCFSDIEGGNPFKLSDNNSINNELKENFIFENGLIVNFNKSNTALAFLGDLLDNQIYSMRLLKSFNNLKDKYNDRVILVGGNRDFNKIRMGIELFIQDERGDLPWTGTKNFDELKTRLSTVKFKFRLDSVPEYLQNVGLWNKFIPDLLKLYPLGFVERLDGMFLQTLGISASYMFLLNELNEIYSLGLTMKDELSAKIICTFEMIKSFNWGNLPEYLKEYEGAYMKYLNNTHIIALFKINNKYGLLSHSGIPQNTLDGKNNRKLSYPMGYDYEKIKIGSNLKTVISKLEEEKMELLKEVNNKRNENYSFDKDVMINKFVHLTATTFCEKSDGATPANSPVVWSQLIHTNLHDDIKVQLGGDGYSSWLQNDKLKEHLYVNDGSDIISYNIYGHGPQYFNPTYFRKENTLHVNLDVSKIEAHRGNFNSSNSNSFAFFCIGNKNKIMGKIKFPETKGIYPYPSKKISDLKKTDPTNPEIKTLEALIYQGNAYLTPSALSRAGTIYNYEVVIPEGSTQLLLSDNIPGTNIKVDSYPGIDFTKYLYN
jgi:hypothetical protein